MTFRAALAAACEASECGDDDLARQIIRELLENFGDEELGPHIFCSVCGVGPMWPGPAADHLERVHGVGDELAETAA